VTPIGIISGMRSERERSMSVARNLAVLLGVVALSAPLAAFAQQAPAAPPAPPDAQSAPPPSYARPATPSGEETIAGRVASYDGKYQLVVNDDRGYVDNVELRQGTIINPTGVRLAPGMRVTIAGVNRGPAFVANQIDTPYTQYGFAYPVYGVGVYPVYPYYPWGYGGRVSIGIGFGSGYGYHWH
jgi:hypothetical protein